MNKYHIHKKCNFCNDNFIIYDMYQIFKDNYGFASVYDKKYQDSREFCGYEKCLKLIEGK